MKLSAWVSGWCAALALCNFLLGNWFAGIVCVALSGINGFLACQEE